MIRIATENDAERLLEIYSYYVKNTAISFEYDVPTVSEFKMRIRETLMRYPYIVSESDGKIVGYAYANAFKGRRAYDWSVETTIYLQKDERKKGLGKELYTSLEKLLSLQNVINLNACIGYPANDDEHLTKNSFGFHKHLGFRLVGEFHKCGYKFNNWYNMVWMEKCISKHPDTPLNFIKFDQIREEAANKYQIS